MTCKNCNAPLEKQARFCIKCGARVSESQGNQLPATTQPDVAKTADPPLPKKVDRPIRPPKRPLPQQPVPPKQDASEKEQNGIHKQSIHISKLDQGHKDAIEPIHTSINSANKQLAPNNADDDASAEKNPLSDQPTIIAKLDSLQDADYHNGPTIPVSRDSLRNDDYDNLPTIIVSHDSLQKAQAEQQTADTKAEQQTADTKAEQQTADTKTEQQTADTKTEQQTADTKTEQQQSRATPVTPFELTTLPFEARSIPHPELVDLEGTEEAEDKLSMSSLEDAQPLVYYRLNTTMKGSQKLPAAVNKTAYNQKEPKRGLGCFLGCLTTFVVVLLVLGGTWVFALRPYAHDLAQSQLNNALTSAVNQIPTQAKQLPPESTIPINENTINNLIVLNLAPSNPVQHPTTSISTSTIRLDFQLYNFPCAITLVPMVNNGRLVVSQIGVEGIFSAIMSPDEMTNLLNTHLNDAQSKLQRTIMNVQLKDHEVDLTLS
jgi:hypothetical protein